MAFCSKCGKEISDGFICAECEAKEKQDKEKSIASLILDTKDTTSNYSKEEIEKNKIFCGFAYIPILFWLPLVVGTKGSSYCKFHANNGLLLLVFAIVSSILSLFFGIIPILGSIIGTLFGLVILGYIIFGMVFTFQGKVKEFPFVGGIKIIS